MHESAFEGHRAQARTLLDSQNVANNTRIGSAAHRQRTGSANRPTVEKKAASKLDRFPIEAPIKT